MNLERKLGECEIKKGTITHRAFDCKSIDIEHRYLCHDARECKYQLVEDYKKYCEINVFEKKYEK